MSLKILTSQGCACGANLSIVGDRKPLRGIHGKYTTGGGERTFYAKIECFSSKCGLLYEPDHERFAGAFNELADRLFRH
jgi:hypothetical protein